MHTDLLSFNIYTPTLEHGSEKNTYPIGGLMEQFKCVVCGHGEYRILKWPNFLIAHWRINPGLAFNELVLGQKVPEEIFLCTNCQFGDRACYAKCPQCGEFIHSLEFGVFGYWLGYLCPRCYSEIPTTWNFTSKGILFLVKPVVKLFSKKFEDNYPSYVKRKIEKAKPRYDKFVNRCKTSSD